MTPAAVDLVETDASAAGALLDPFDEQTALDVAAGRRALFALRKTQGGSAAGSAVLGAGALDLFVAPEFRAAGLGGAAAARLLERAGAGPLTAWSHEDHPAARALAARFGFTAVRTLLQLRLELLGLDTPPAAATRPSGILFTSFRPGVDDAEWVALNARVFAWHPEQGSTTAADLAERQAEPWFRADDFLVARDDDGAMIGYNWLKIEPDGPTMSTGEIYVIGVAPEAAGKGLGRSLMDAGLARLRELGCTAAELYVEADNASAVHLYRSLGFRDHRVHVQYARV
ncbi:mycothiol synthase [Gryllotalpicola koreensis]|uniref:Mycothiol acetyltransferase n=1 Tax=Gryllotalpicola koreensis TaxID=993086 RepID=A0ABP8A3N3_9MICO